MSFIDSIKNFYYSMEDKYYAILDKINEHIPIYKIIDPIDSVFPSFILVIILIILLILFLIFAFVPGAVDILPAPLSGIVRGIISAITFGALPLGGGMQATIFVQAQDTSPIEDAIVTVVIGGKDFSGNADSNGAFIVKPLPQEKNDAKITVEKTGFTTKTITTTLQSGKAKIITLTPKPPPVSCGDGTCSSNETKTSCPADCGTPDVSIRIVDEDNELITKSVSVTFHCNSGTAPASRTVSTGIVEEFTPPSVCTTLTADFSSSGFVSKTGVRINGNPTTVVLEGEKGTVTVSVEDDSGDELSGVDLSLNKNGSQYADSGTTDSSGEYEFTDVASGTYTVSATKEGYEEAESDSFSIEGDASENVSITMDAIAIGNQRKIFIKVTDLNTHEVITGATMIVYSGTTPIEPNGSTDEFGIYERNPVDNTQTYDIAIKKNGYRTEIRNDVPKLALNVTTPTAIALEKITVSPRNYGEIMAHVTKENFANAPGADVYLYNTKAPGLLINFPKDVTNADGNVLMSPYPNGDYNIRVVLGSLTGTANTTIANNSTTYVNIPLVLGSGTMEITAKDEDTGTGINAATVTFINVDTGATIGTCTTSGSGTTQGKCESARILAGTKVMAKAEKEGYAAGFTTTYTIVTNEKKTPPPIMLKSLPGICDDVPDDAVCGWKANSSGGTTEQTFSNACEAALNGFGVKCMGSCPCSPVECTNDTDCSGYSCPTGTEGKCDTTLHECTCDGPVNGLLKMDFVGWCDTLSKCQGTGPYLSELLSNPTADKDYYAKYAFVFSKGVDHNNVTQNIRVSANNDNLSLPQGGVTTSLSPAVTYLNCTNATYNPTCTDAGTKQANIFWQHFPSALTQSSPFSLSVIIKGRVKKNLGTGDTLELHSKAQEIVSIAQYSKEIESTPTEDHWTYSIGQVTCPTSGTNNFAWGIKITDPSMPAGSQDIPLSSGSNAKYSLIKDKNYKMQITLKNCSSSDYSITMKGANVKSGSDLTASTPEQLMLNNKDCDSTGACAMEISRGGSDLSYPETIADGQNLDRGDTMSIGASTTDEINLLPKTITAFTKIALGLIPPPTTGDPTNGKLASFKIDASEQLTIEGLQPLGQGYPTWIISGTVKNRNGDKIQGAKIYLMKKNSAGNYEPLRTSDSAPVDTTDSVGHFYTEVSPTVSGIDYVYLKVTATNYSDKIEAIPIISSTISNAKYKCIKITAAGAPEKSVLNSDYTIGETEVNNALVDSYAAAVISTQDCTEPFTITINDSDNLQEGTAYLRFLGSPTPTTVNLNASKATFLAGAAAGVQGDYKIIINAGSDAAHVSPVHVLYVRFGATNSCFSMSNTIKPFTFPIKNSGTTANGSLNNSCSVKSRTKYTNTAKYPQFNYLRGSSDNEAETVLTDAEKLAPINVDWTIKAAVINSAIGDNCETGLGSPDKQESGTATIDPNSGISTIGDVPVSIVNLIKDTKGEDNDSKPICIRTYANNNPPATVYVDAKDSTIKAVMNATDRQTEPVTITNKALSATKYAIAEYKDFINPAQEMSLVSKNSSTGKAEFNITINVTTYKITNGVITSTLKTQTVKIPADGVEHAVSSITLTGGDFYTVSTPQQTAKAWFLDGSTKSNVTTSSSATINAATVFAYQNPSKEIDIALAFDTSASTYPELVSGLCKKIGDVKTKLGGLGFDVKIKLYGLELPYDKWPNPMKTECTAIGIFTAQDYKQTKWQAKTGGIQVLPATNMQECTSAGIGPTCTCPVTAAPNGGGCDDNHEAWAPGMNYIMQDTASGFADDAKKVIIFVGDNDPTGKRCANYYENNSGDPALCSPQWRGGNLANEKEFITNLVTQATNKGVNIFFLYDYPINHEYLNLTAPIDLSRPKIKSDDLMGDGELIVNKASGYNDVYDIYAYVAKKTGGAADAITGQEFTSTSENMMLETILGTMLPVGQQKFRIKLDAGTAESDCGNDSGGNPGYTGSSANVPKIMLSWKWSDISSTTCNDTYCDQAQFYISLLQRLKTISDNETATSQDLQFSANLIGDNYSTKFIEDFITYANGTGQTFFGTPAWFNDAPQGNKKWQKYIANSLTAGTTSFTMKLKTGTTTQTIGATPVTLEPGVYNVAIYINAISDADKEIKYRLLNTTAAISSVEVVLQRDTTASSNYDSPLYRMPIDATVGVAGTNREGLYGIKFTNSGSAISLFESGILTSNVSKGKRNINASLKESYNDTKEGMVLKVGYDAATKNPLNIEFSPSMAVPVIATVTSTTTTSNNAKALLGYAVSSGSNVYGGGKYWKIAGSQNTDKCKDFRGEEIRTADSTITTDARNMNYSCTTDVFGLTWTGIGNAMSSKNVFLETSFFVPSPVGTTGGSYSLNKPCPTATVSFCTPEYGPSQTRVELASTIFRTKTLADVFNAVKERKICVSNDSENVYFWWNPREIDKQLETTGSCLSPITALNARCQ